VRSAILLLSTAALFAQDPREIVRRSVELDQVNWLRMKDYTWTAQETDRHLDSNGKVQAVESKRWETTILYGEAFRRMLARNGTPLSAGEQRKEQHRLDKETAKFEQETLEERARRLAKLDKDRAKERDFLREIPDAYDFRILRDDQVDGHAVWIIAATPKRGYTPKHSDAKAFARIKGEIWIDKAEYQWVRLEAETIDTISFGWILARLNPGAKLIFEQTRVNNDLWLPKRELVRGSGRVALLKKIALEQEVTWNNYHKFQADSKVVTVE
jgi:hypothetical protein